MAGRGTDIKLGEGVKELGGLAVIGTERHESRRIDNQLRGRSGRQGDPGVTQFYLSMEDELMRRFGSDNMKSMMNVLVWTITSQFKVKWYQKPLNLHKNALKAITLMPVNSCLNMMMFFVNNGRLFTNNDLMFLKRKSSWNC